MLIGRCGCHYKDVDGAKSAFACLTMIVIKQSVCTYCAIQSRAESLSTSNYRTFSDNEVQHLGKLEMRKARTHTHTHREIHGIKKANDTPKLRGDQVKRLGYEPHKNVGYLGNLRQSHSSYLACLNDIRKLRLFINIERLAKL